MNVRESLRVAMRGLASNKMRTALTMLGIIIGVGVVILVVAIGQGAAQSVTEAVNSLGTNLLSIFPGQARFHINAATIAGNTTSTNRLTLDDAKLIARLVELAHKVLTLFRKKIVDLSSHLEQRIDVHCP